MMPPPTSSTTPATSRPVVCGSSPGIVPLRRLMSTGLTPVARTATRICPGPGCGSGRSTSSSTSGPPYSLNWTAFTVTPPGSTSLHDKLCSCHPSPSAGGGGQTRPRGRFTPPRAGPATRADNRGRFTPSRARPATQADNRGRFTPSRARPATQADNRGRITPSRARPATPADNRGRFPPSRAAPATRVLAQPASRHPSPADNGLRRRAQLPGPIEDSIVHRLGQLAGERVLLAGGKAAEQREPAELRLGSVAEARPRARHRFAAQGERAQRGIPGERAQADDHPRSTKQRELADEVRQAGVALDGRRLVRRRRTADGRSDPAAGQPQPVVERDRLGLIGIAGPPQRREQPVARAVPGEHASGPVAAVGRRRQTEHHDRGDGIAKAGQRLAPVLLVGERRTLDARDLLAPGDQPRAAPARDDLVLERGELAHARASGSIPKINRSITGARSSRLSGTPSRTWRDTSSEIAPTIANGSSGDTKRPISP